MNSTLNDCRHFHSCALNAVTSVHRSPDCNVGCRLAVADGPLFVHPASSKGRHIAPSGERGNAQIPAGGFETSITPHYRPQILHPCQSWLSWLAMACDPNGGPVEHHADLWLVVSAATIWASRFRSNPLA